MMADFMARKLSVLVLEDIENDALLVVRQLNSHGLQFDWERVETAVEFEAALDRQSWDVIIADYDLPTIQAPDALAIATRRGIRTPIIVVSGIIGEETAVEVIKLGAVDYLLKDRLARLGAAVQHGIERERERAKTEQLELQLRNERETLEREQRFRALCDRAPVGIFFVDATGKWDYTNRYAKDKFNLSVDQNGEISWSEIVHPDDCEAVLSSWNSSQLGREEFRAEFRLASSHESERWVLAIATIEVSLDGQPGLPSGPSSISPRARQRRTPFKQPSQHWSWRWNGAPRSCPKRWTDSKASRSTCPIVSGSE
ncbi:MAG: response regulator [Phycisphaera sp. RhM]|nr:response regulator [Phycisphaera sp. RhM]